MRIAAIEEELLMPSVLPDRWGQRFNGQRREAFVPGECHPCVIRSAKETVTRRQDRCDRTKHGGIVAGDPEGAFVEMQRSSPMFLRIEGTRRKAP
jgi:hypothetical protein